MRKVQFKKDHFYYVSNKAREGTSLFDDKWDYARFVFSLQYLNTEESVGKLGNVRHYMKPDYRGDVSVGPFDDPLVEIAAFSLLPDSFHIVLKQLREKGVSRFMQKLGTGYAGHLNSKRGTRGGVFQGSYDAVAVDEDQLEAVVRFVHMLPLALHQKDWFHKGFDDEQSAKDFLADYPWSSYWAYTKKQKLAFLHPRGVGEEYTDFVFSWKPS